MESLKSSKTKPLKTESLKNLKIYVLKLEQNKYYVGKTKNPDFRLQNHIDGVGSIWTKKYKPIEVELLIDGDDFDEDKYVLKYMKMKGIDNVRGGSFSKFNLDDETIEQIERMLISADDKCFECGESGHFIRNCPNKYERQCNRCGKKGHYEETCYVMVNNYDLKKNEKKEQPALLSVLSNIFNTILNEIGEDNKCERCGRDHPTENCYASYHANGKKLK